MCIKQDFALRHMLGTFGTVTVEYLALGVAAAQEVEQDQLDGWWLNPRISKYPWAR